MQSLLLSFGKKLPIIKTHGMAAELLAQEARIQYINGKGQSPPDKCAPQAILYVVRDVRDCLTSNYYWWRTSQESKCGGILPSFRGVTPEAYISGQVLLVAVPNPVRGCGVTQAHIDRGIFSNPAGFWAQHVSGYLEHNIPFIRYEDLLRSPRKTLLDVADRFGMPRPWFPRTPRRLVGHAPRKGIIGDYRTLFNERTLRLIEDRAGAVMARLGYELT